MYAQLQRTEHSDNSRTAIERKTSCSGDATQNENYTLRYPGTISDVKHATNNINTSSRAIATPVQSVLCPRPVHNAVLAVGASLRSLMGAMSTISCTEVTRVQTRKAVPKRLSYQLISTCCLTKGVARRNDIGAMPAGAIVVRGDGHLILWPDSTTEFRDNYAVYGGELRA